MVALPKKKLALTGESFDALLAWLDRDRESAGRKYETIRTGLIKIFISKGFSDAEDLADLTINRVIARLPDIQDSYVGEPVSYFRGVARNIIHEARRRKEIVIDITNTAIGDPQEVSGEVDCLRKCLKLLSPDQRKIALEYYLNEKHAKIAHHRRLAREMGLSATALRVRAHRIRATLQKWVRECIENER